MFFLVDFFIEDSENLQIMPFPYKIQNIFLTIDGFLLFLGPKQKQKFIM